MPKILKQGENYDGDYEANKDKEEAVVNGPENDVEEANTQNKDTEKKTFKENTVLIIAILAAAAVVFIILLGIIVSRKNKTVDYPNGGKFDYSEDNLDTSDGSGEDDLFDQLMANAGEGEPVETPSSDGQPSVEYTDSEAVELRKHGYTADEIEWSREHGITYDSMLSAAESAAEELAKEKIKLMGDTGSPEYQALINKTWLGGEEFELTEVLPDEYGAYDIEYSTQVINADYVKCGQQGSQLFLCVSTAEYGNVFLTVEPKRWMQLQESGNIVVEVNVCHYGGKAVVVSVSEVDTGDHPEM